jgi:hypothetical protein
VGLPPEQTDQIFSAFFHHEAAWHWHGFVHQPLYRRIA